MQDSIDRVLYNLLLNNIRLLLILSFLAIVLTIAVLPFTFESLKLICVCNSNYLTYSMLGFGISVLLAFGGFHFLFNYQMNASSGHLKKARLALLLQVLSFIAGMGWLIFFEVSLLDVI